MSSSQKTSQSTSAASTKSATVKSTKSKATAVAKTAEVESEKNESEKLLTESPTPASGPQRVLIVEPDEARRKLMVGIALALMPGSTIQEAEDEDEAEVALEEDDFDVAVLDFQVPGFTASEFVRTVNNNEGMILVSLSLADLEPGDELNKVKMDPLRKLFERPKE